MGMERRGRRTQATVIIQLLNKEEDMMKQDRVCQSYEPPEHGACLLGTQEIQALPSQAHCQGFQLAARDSGQRPQSILSLAERSDPKVMSMHKELSVKSRVRGDFHARFCERVRVKLPRSTRPRPLCLTNEIFPDICLTFAVMDGVASAQRPTTAHRNEREL